MEYVEKDIEWIKNSNRKQLKKNVIKICIFRTLFVIIFLMLFFYFLLQSLIILLFVMVVTIIGACIFNMIYYLAYLHDIFHLPSHIGFTPNGLYIRYKSAVRRNKEMKKEVTWDWIKKIIIEKGKNTRYVGNDDYHCRIIKKDGTSLDVLNITQDMTENIILYYKKHTSNPIIQQNY